MNAAVIVAGGNGTRMNLDENKSKQFLLLGGVPVIIRTLRAFCDVPKIECIVVVTRKDDINEIKSLINEYNVENICSVVSGGAERQDSVLRGIEAVYTVCDAVDNILIHDGARPFVTHKCINSVLSALDSYNAAAAGVAVTDTIKRINNGKIILETIDRENLISIQTPQGFKGDLILAAHLEAQKQEIKATDDCALIEALTNEKIKVTDGSYNNIKITTPEDIIRGESILNSISK